jgi:hypothetical protein
MAEDEDGRCASSIVGRIEQTTDRRRNAKRREIACRHELAADRFGGGRPTRRRLTGAFVAWNAVSEPS